MDAQALGKVVWEAYNYAPVGEPDSLEDLYERVNERNIGDGLFTTLVSEVYEGVLEGAEAAVLKRLDGLLLDIRSVRDAVAEHFLEQNGRTQ